VTKSKTRQPAVLRYPGSKWSAAGLIAEQFAEHYHYIEPYFGSGAVFFSKEPSPHEVINDLNGNVVNMFRVLRDRTDELCWQLELTPWAREEYALSDEETGDELEDARRFIVRCWQAHASDLAKKTGWKNRGATQRARGMSHRWAKVPDQLREIALRLQDAEIENRDALALIQRFNRDDCLIYADPPYLMETRTQRMYACEMSEEDHTLMLKHLLDHKGPVVISGYSNSLYDETLVGWQRHDFKATKAEKGAPRREVLWVKP